MSTPTPDIDKLDKISPITPKIGGETPEEGKFASFMNEKSVQTSISPSGPTPMELSSSGIKPISSPPTIADIQNQIQSVSSSLGDVKNQLHTKGLKLKQSDKYLLRSKLSSANENIRSAAEKSGVTTGPQPDLSQKNSPVAKFLELVTDGQRQLGSAALELQNLNSSGESVSAAKLLLVQAKLQKASQELDFSSVILGKSTEMLKTLMNVQI
ncbi:MAG: hypothetical protein FJZ59_04180 [Chlamydiae bacterium]|jgi:putative cell wall-binding protein|nr:hypothetical protein [Chlamydiota bacterium]